MTLGNKLAFFPLLLIDALKEFLRVYVLMNSLQVLPGCGLSSTFFFSSRTLISTRLRDKCEFAKALEAARLWNFLSAVLKYKYNLCFAGLATTAFFFLFPI